MNVTIKKCARCGQEHVDLEFKPFLNAPVQDGDGTFWTHWATCPVTTEPIILRVSMKDE